MTGYASAQAAGAATAPATEGRAASTRRLGLEIRSVNSRFLDLAFRLPDELRALEPSLRSLLTSQIKRGKVEVRATLESTDTTSVPDPSPRLLQRLNAAQDTIRSWLPQATPLSVADVLRLSVHSGPAEEDWSPTALELAEQALAALLEARAQEGARLATMLQGHLAQLRSLAQQAVPLVPKLVEQQRQRFQDIALVVSNEHALRRTGIVHAAGSSAIMQQPFPGELVTFSHPPSRSIRCRM